MNFMLLDAEFAVRRALNKVFREENGEVNIIATVVLIGIAIALASIFRTEIEKILKSLLKAIGQKAEKAIK